MSLSLTMAAAGRRSNLLSRAPAFLGRRNTTTSAQHVAARAIDPTFEKLMSAYKHLFKVVAVQDLILASPALSLPLPLLSAAARRLRLNRGAPAFIHKFPRVFSLAYDPVAAHPVVRLTPDAARLARAADSSSLPSAAAARLSRLLAMSPSRTIPLRAVFRLWRELALPDDFEDSVLAANPALFSLRANPKEPNTHILSLLGPDPRPNLVPAIDAWRARERAREGNKADEMEVKFGFRQAFPPGMKLRKDFRAKLREWQRLPYDGPYDEPRRRGRRAAEKRAVAMMHELLSWTAEGMVEVEKVSHLRRWFGMELNIRDVFLDHPGLFYLSTKGKRHTVFLREMYDRGGLAEPNPVYDARRGLLELVLMRRRGMVHGGVSPSEPPSDDDEESDDDASDCEG